MPNTFKKSTFLYIIAAVLAPYIVMPLLISSGIYASLMINYGSALSYVHIWVLSIPICGILAFLSFRRGKKLANDAAPVPAKTANPNRKYVIAGVAVVAVIAVGYGVKTGRLFIQGVSHPPIEGTYRDQSGSKVEFLANGSILGSTGNSTASARWSMMDGTRLRIEPEGVGFLGQVCEYRFRSYSALSIANCDFRMNLTRM